MFAGKKNNIFLSTNNKCHVTNIYRVSLMVAGRGSRVAGRGSRVAGRGSRVAGFKSRVAGFKKVAGFQKSRVVKRLYYMNITKNKIYTL